MNIPTDSQARLSEDGFMILSAACDHGLLSQISKVCLQQSKEVRTALASRDIGIGSAVGFDEIVQRSPGRWDVPITPEKFGLDAKKLPWWPLMATMLGEDAEHAFSGVVSSVPGSCAQHWHIDSPHESKEHAPMHAINVLVAIENIPMEMGPTEFASGSHRLTNHLSNASLIPEELIYQHQYTTPERLVKGTQIPLPKIAVNELSAGDCLVFDDRILHRGGANQSNEIRHVVYFSYCKKAYVGTTHFEAQRSLFDVSAG
ncbi:MAG: phytanoyl-CoA dioxygenase family protein [bacterium]|nr:hypothetical protein [Gammaproteobacteria bacterium]HIL98231.1 hypothetical protein [Pseudomonadales bacterium]